MCSLSPTCMWCFPKLCLHRCCFSHLFVKVGLKHRYQKFQIQYAHRSKFSSQCLLGSNSSQECIFSFTQTEFKQFLSGLCFHWFVIVTITGHTEHKTIPFSLHNVRFILRSFTNIQNVGSTLTQKFHETNNRSTSASSSWMCQECKNIITHGMAAPTDMSASIDGAKHLLTSRLPIHLHS